MNIRENISEVLEDIKKYSPNPEKVKLIAVTKYTDTEKMQDYINAGYNIFGENKAQIIRDKITFFKEKNIPVEWHFIGNLQSNKVKYIIDDTVLIHSVNKLSLAEEINKRAEQKNKIMNVLLEINIYGEESKQGYDFEVLKNDIGQLQNLKNINIIGLMTMAPLDATDDIKTFVFSSLKKIKDELNEKYFNGTLKELSMGMSNDYKLALKEGSTIIRIGSKLLK